MTDAGLEEVFDFLREIAGINIVLARTAREAIANLDPRVSLKLDNVKLGAALELIQETCTVPLQVEVRHGVLVVSASQTLPEEGDGQR